MFDRQNQLKTRAAQVELRVVRRRRLNALVVAAIFSGGSVLTAGVSTGDQSSLMPRQIPSARTTVKPTSDAADVRRNPFLPQPTQVQMSPVRLASGDEVAPTLKLKPVGIAVGLHSIGEDTQPRAVRPKLTVQRPNAPRVQTNNYLESVHHGAKQLLNAEVDSTPKISRRVLRSQNPSGQDYYSQPATFDGAAIVPRPSVSRLTHQNIQQAAGEIVESAAPIEFSFGDESETVIPTESSQGSTVKPSASAPPPPAPIEPSGAFGEAYRFSLTDTSESKSETLQEADRNSKQTETVPNVAGPVLGDVGDAAVGIADAIMFDDQPATDISPAPAIAMEEPVVAPEIASNQTMKSVVSQESENFVDEFEGGDFADLIAPIVMGDAEGDMSDEGMSADEVVPSLNGDVIDRSIVIRGSDEDPADRWRPPVAVAAPPASFQHAAGDSNGGVVRSAITAGQVGGKRFPEQTLHWKSPSNGVVSSGSLPAPIQNGVAEAASDNKQIAAAKPAPAAATPLYMTRAQVRSLTIRGHLHKVSVTDRSVCQAVAAGTSQIKLIGTGNGVTELVVWASLERDQPAISRAFQIHVTDSVEASSDPASEKMAILSQSIRHAFPNADVTIQLLTDKMVVSGRCPSEDSAKKVIRMVRKTCLVPVIDELVVR